MLSLRPQRWYTVVGFDLFVHVTLGLKPLITMTHFFSQYEIASPFDFIHPWWVNLLGGSRSLKLHYFFKTFFNIYLFLKYKERQSTSRGGKERERETESEGGSRFWAVSTEPNVGLEPTNRETMTWAEVRCLTNWATQVP